MVKENSTHGGSLTERVYESLRADIITCRLDPGERMKISDLCERVGANLSAVREALSRLSSDGLVISEPQKGFRVAPLTVKDLDDIAFTRIEVELICLRCSMGRGGVEWESEIVAAFHRLSRTEQVEPGAAMTVSEEYLEAASRFFEAVMGACDNQFLLNLRRQIYYQYERYRRLIVNKQLASRDLNAEFNQLTQAVLDGNLPLAEARLRMMLTPFPEIRESLEQLLNDVPAVENKPKRRSRADTPKKARA